MSKIRMSDRKQNPFIIPNDGKGAPTVEDARRFKESAKVIDAIANNHDQLQDRISQLEKDNARLLKALRGCCDDSSLWYEEFGEPGDGEYRAAFVDGLNLLKELKG